MKPVRSLSCFALLACVMAACSGSVTQGPDTNGGDVGTGGAQGAFVLTSPAFANAGWLGAQYQCGLTGVSPPLSWSAGPRETQSYALVMVGPDGPGATDVYHWVIWDIPAATASLPEAVAQSSMPPVPAGSSQISASTAGATWAGYSGPCFSFPTTYTFTVFALDVAKLPGVTPASTGANVFAAIQTHALASAQLSVLAMTYRS